MTDIKIPKSQKIKMNFKAELREASLKTLFSRVSFWIEAPKPKPAIEANWFPICLKKTNDPKLSFEIFDEKNDKKSRFDTAKKKFPNDE